MEDRAKKIIEACLHEKSKTPLDIFNNIAQMDFVRIHGPEHHVLDGAALSISMGCNVRCPFIGRAFDDNWCLEDPTGKSDEEFKVIIKEIEDRIIQLKNALM